MLTHLLCCLLIASNVSFAAAKLPPTITPCHRDDPNLDRCIIDAVYKLRPLLATGDFGDGYRTPRLEPLLLDNIEMSRGKQFAAVFSDVEARGGSNFTINELRANPAAISYDVSLTLPRIDFVGKYFLKLNILLLNLQGNGDMSGSFEKAQASVRMRGERYLQDGVEYVRFTAMPMVLSVGSMQLQLDDLFNRDSALSELGNSIINDQQELYLQEIVPGLEKGLSKKFLAVANQILETATFDEMFPK